MPAGGQPRLPNMALWLRTAIKADSAERPEPPVSGQCETGSAPIGWPHSAFVAGASRVAVNGQFLLATDTRSAKHCPAAISWRPLTRFVPHP